MPQTKERHREYLKEYRKREQNIRIYVPPKSAVDTEEAQNLKLDVIEELLKYRYCWPDSTPETDVEPKVEKYPIQGHPLIGTAPATVTKPIFDKQTGKQMGTITTHETVTMVDKQLVDVGTLTKTEVIPEALQPTVDRIWNFCWNEDRKIQKLRIKRDIEFFLGWSARDLIAERNDNKIWYLSRNKEELLKNQAEWRLLVNEKRAAQNEFEDLCRVLFRVSYKVGEAIDASESLQLPVKEYFIEDAIRLLADHVLTLMKLEVKLNLAKPLDKETFQEDKRTAEMLVKMLKEKYYGNHNLLWNVEQDDERWQ
jgi:hypothetical protein